MHRALAIPFLTGGLLVTTGCQNPGTSLDDVIQEHLDLRARRAAQQCECYQLYIDLTDPNNATFASEQACLASQPASTDDAVDCIKTVLGSSAYDNEGSIEAMQCYNSALQDSVECHAENALECSETASSHCTESDVANNSLCQGKLSDDEVSAIAQCAAQ